jgi:hypothetical protein
VAAGGLQQVEGADDVHLGVEHGLDHRLTHVRLGRLVRNHFGAYGFHDPVDGRLVAQVRLVQARPWVHVLALAG